jgi:FixJ family two-component response regulator
MSVGAMKLGAVEFLTKPFRDHDLLHAIRGALETPMSVDAKKQTRASDADRAAHLAEIEKSLLALHAAVDMDSFWRAVQRVITTSISCCNLGLTLQHNPVLPMIVKWMRPIPEGAFDVELLQKFLRTYPRSKFIRLSDVFPKRAELLKSAFYRQYMESQGCEDVVGLFFWSGKRLNCVIVIMPYAKQIEILEAEVKVLRHLYAQFEIALRRIGTLEREHATRMALEEFLRRLPLPTMLVRWNLQLAYQNKAAREFCLLWREGPVSSRVMKATAQLSDEILDGCRRLKQRWQEASGLNAPQPIVEREVVHHSKWRHLRATISVKPLNLAGLSRPHFLIECEEMRPRGDTPRAAVDPPLSHLARLTRREQEVTRLVCEGRSNQEIADTARLSLPMVKKHLHRIFRKLEVSSRSRLMALMA